MDVAKETNADMVLCNYTKVDEKGNLLKYIMRTILKEALEFRHIYHAIGL